MAKPKRKASNRTPVTRHQLFPAVMALWFGALFGLGSLAVRPSLLEEFVIKSRIDLLIPAAAPPLGMTARMLVALALAVLGAMLGTLIARHIARPKSEAYERKRTKLSTRDEGAESPYQGRADASTSDPHATQSAVAVIAPGAPTGRRRALAIAEEIGEFVPHEMAPLPGGAPHIFDIAAAGLIDTPPPEPAPAAVNECSGSSHTAVSNPVALDWTNAAPVLPPTAGMPPIAVPQAIAAQHQMFEPNDTASPDEAVAASQPASPAELPHPGEGRQVFGITPSTTLPADQPRQIFGMPVVEGHVPKEYVEAKGFRTSVFDTPEPSPLFPARAETAASSPEPAHDQQAAAIPSADESAAVVDMPAVVEQPPVSMVEVAPEPALPSPASLGMNDLSARLAEAMRRRRSGRAAAAAAAASETGPDLPVAPAPAAPQAVQIAAAEAVQAYAVPPLTVPRFTVPDAAVPDGPATAVPAAAAQVDLPPALRPLDLTGFEEQDQQAQDSLLPPRRIAMLVETAPTEDEQEATDDAANSEADYGSLLGVTPSPVSLRNPYVRVEEPEAEVSVAEPVVIFPGQALPAPHAFAAPVTAGDDASSFRRFDALANAEQGQPIAAHETVNAVPPEEAELALRSALANLQRMSGAA